DSKIAQQNISQESPIVEKMRNKKNFRFVKVIPDELPIYFWDQPADTDTYLQNLQQLDQKIYPKTEYLKMSDLLNNKQLLTLYSQVFEKVYENPDFIAPKMFDLEVQRRASYY